MMTVKFQLLLLLNYQQIGHPLIAAEVSTSSVFKLNRNTKFHDCLQYDQKQLSELCTALLLLANGLITNHAQAMNPSHS